MWTVFLIEESCILGTNCLYKMWAVFLIGLVFLSGCFPYWAVFLIEE
jgi:hypothetical protein